ncbi:MAG: guanylate kinase [Gammaproteobacteria bacterium]
MSHHVSQQGQLYIVAAPSGAGKTSLVTALLDAVPGIQVSISHTTRPKRSTEEDGVNYFFIDESDFLAMKARGEFLESAEVFHHHYGTSKQWVLETLSRGIDVILEIDWQGAQSIRELMADTIGIFILPPSLEVLQSRLMGRKTDDLAVIAERLAEATEEMSHYPEFDYLIVNDNFQEALASLITIVHAARLRTHIMVRTHHQVLDAFK